jgi:hypothetical protein
MAIFHLPNAQKVHRAEEEEEADVAKPSVAD